MLYLYHGTDAQLANRIINEGFRIKPNKSHWLGNGIYFYQDYSLAKWWTTKPSKNFGSKIETPSILKCSIDENNVNILNLLKLDEYNQFCEEFEEEFWPMYSERIPKEIPHYTQVRCSYCDILKSMNNLDVIIGDFFLPNQPYRRKTKNEILKKFHLEYTETQVCVFDGSKIKIEEIITL